MVFGAPTGVILSTNSQYVPSDDYTAVVVIEEPTVQTVSPGYPGGL